MRSGMPEGIVVMREWEDLGCAAYQSHVYDRPFVSIFAKSNSLSLNSICRR